ncbi:DUF2207 domain-containing protein, partial [Mailhella massiliensis]
MKRYVVTLFLCLLMAAECFAAPVRVREFNALVDVAGNGDIVVSETLRVEIPVQGEFHGIFRDIPVVTRWREQGRASMDVLAVRLDGQKLAKDDVRREARIVRVYQRDRTKVLEPGVHEFFLSYRMTGQVGLFGENDELTWNVTGSGWEAPVDEASCTVLGPPGAPFFAQSAWLGKAGSRQSPVAMTHEVADGRLVMRFEALRPVRPGEEFTVAAGWEKGFVVLERASGAEQGTVLFALLDTAIFLYFFLVWFFIGRDPKKGVIVPRFHPPRIRRAQGGDGKEPESVLSPAAAGFLFSKGQVTPGCFGAALISLAGRGCCLIEGNAKEGFFLKRGAGSSPHAEENGILEFLGDGFAVDREHGETLYAMRRNMTKQLRQDYGSLWKGAGEGILTGLFGSAWMFLGMAAMLIGLAAVTGYVTGGVMPEGFMGVLVPLLFLFFLFRRMPRASMALFRSGRRAPFVFSLFFQACALAFMGFFIITVSRDTLDFFSPAERGLAALALLIPLFFSSIMDAPTKEARALLDEIEGLALYMRMAEGPTLNELNPPEHTLRHYRELLPYAVALGLEQAWGARF